MIEINYPEDIVLYLKKLSEVLHEDDRFRPSTTDFPVKKLLLFAKLRGRLEDVIVLMEDDIKKRA